MAETLLLSVLIILIAMALLCVKLLVGKGSFGSMHIHDSKAMRQRGIDCAIEQDRAAGRKRKTKVNF